MIRKFVAYLLAISMLAANVDYTVFAAEEEKETVSDLAEGTNAEVKIEETEPGVEKKSIESFSSDVEVEFETLKKVQENEETEKTEEEYLTEADNTLEEEETIFIQAEMQGVYEFGESPLDVKQDDYAAYSMQSNLANEYIYQEIMKSYEAGESGTEIRVYDYGFSENDITHIVSGLKNDYPELYFVNKKFTYAVSGNCIVSIIVTYDTSLSPNKFKQSTEEALSVIKPGMSDLEKAIVLHDYLTVNCEYDKERLANKTMPYISYTAYGVLVEHIAVCQGYALAYKYLLNQAGIECYMVSSDSMNHAWNLIVLDGEYYQVDVTWDDPTWDITGRARHTYMFLSDSAFEKAGSGHSNWNVTSGMDIVDYKATSTRYDSAFWSDCNSPLVISEDNCYYVSFSEQAIKKENIENIGGTGTTVCYIGEWPAWGDSSSVWAGTFSGLFQVNDRLYYNDKSSIYSIDLDGGNKRTEFTADNLNGYIYGSALRQGKVYYCLRTTPYVTEKETVLMADIRFNTIEYTITFDADNGLVDISNKTVLSNKACGTLPIPVRDGYDFAGWYTELNGEGELLTAETIITHSMTVYAKWKKHIKPVIMYTVTYDMQGHGTQIESETVEEGSKLTKPETPVAENYTFEGWYKEKTCQTAWDFGKDTVEKDTTLYAKWVENIKPVITCKVTYDMQGHGEQIESETVEEGTKLTEPPTPMEKDYTFEGWYKEKTCRTAWDFAKDTVTKNTTLYAKWVENAAPVITCKVTYDMQGHGEQIASVTVEKGTLLTEPTVPVAKDYKFLGWYKEKTCQTVWNFVKDTVENDITLYAGWSYMSNPSSGDLPKDGVPEGLWIAGIQDYTYTGKAIRPQIRVYFKETQLREGQDYTISCKNNIKAAGMNDKKAPTVTIKGKGNYAGTAVKTFTINKAMLTVSNLKAASVYQRNKAYTPVIILNGNALKDKTDYTLTYKDANGTVLQKQPTKELGSYIMHIEGKGNCQGSFDFKYKIAEKGSASIEKGTAFVNAMIYGGQIPSTMLTLNGKTLTSSDYTVVFSNTNAKGTATATFIGIGEYTGILKKNFMVIAQPLDTNNITVAKSVPYEKGGARPAVSVKANGTKLSEGIDYTVSYKNNTKLGNNAQAIVKGKGNYSGSISVDFEIKSKPLNDKNIKILVSDVVAGKKPVVAIYDANGKKLSQGSDYEVQIDQTKHTVTIAGGKNGCYTGTVSKTYEELPADKIITSVKLNKNANGFPKDYNAYTGKAVTLKNEWLTVKAKNTVLPSNCFTLSYVNNVEKGTATVIVEGKNGYSGIKLMSFKIKAYGLGTILTWFNPNPDETEDKTFTVRFLANGGSWGNKEEMTVAVKSGSTAVLSVKPTREGYVFAGWKDEDGNAFSEDMPVTKDMTVYAQWKVEASSGSFTVTGGTYGIDYRYLDNTLTILTNKPLTIANKDPKIPVSDTILVADKVNADITLTGVNINVKETGSSASLGKAAFQIADDSVGNVTITLAKNTKNILQSGYGRAGVEKDGDKNSGTLIISGDGVLTAFGGYGAAGIGGKNSVKGGNCFHVTITSGEITAYGGCLGAGIGSGGDEGNSGNITINGGNITATGGDYGAGIGGGNSENINIHGHAVVAAAGGKYGAGIGGSGAGGTYGQASLINIRGSAEVTAVGGDYSAGIGGSACSNGKGIRIENNAKVKSTGGEKAAGIGGGGYYNPKGVDIDYGCNGSDIVICDSVEVTAKGGKYGAGIGGGSGLRGCGKGSGITIYGNVIVFVETGGIGHSDLDTGTVSGGSASFIQGVVFNGTVGVIYGSVVLSADAEVPENYTLTVPDGAALDVSHVTFNNNGIITVETGGTVVGDISGNGILKNYDL